MNQRLNTIYTEIQKSNVEKFLKNAIRVDPMIDKVTNGTALQIDLSDEVKNNICNLEKKLVQLEPEALFLTPRQYQHISFNQVVYWAGKYKLGVSETWKRIEIEFTQKFLVLDNVFNSFSITFNELIVTTGAIIWCAVDENNELEILRNKLNQRLPFPPETEKRNHFIHTTVARFKQKLQNPQKLLDFVEHDHKTSTMMVKEIILRKEYRYPSLQTKEIARISLR